MKYKIFLVKFCDFPLTNNLITKSDNLFYFIRYCGVCLHEKDKQCANPPQKSVLCVKTGFYKMHYIEELFSLIVCLSH